ncbi:glutaredoxin [Pantoea phage Phynn]|nr:glutaredoxin [Pantoea phage Phynn]
MDVEIYGIPPHLYRCWGCTQAVKLLDREGIEYTFHAVLVPSDNDLGFAYDRPAIQQLADRIGVRSLAFQYPKIFVDGKLIGGYSDLENFIDNR